MRRREELSLRRVARRAPAVELDARVRRHARRAQHAAAWRRTRRLRGFRRARARARRLQLTHAQLLQHLREENPSVTPNDVDRSIYSRDPRSDGRSALSLSESGEKIDDVRYERQFCRRHNNKFGEICKD